MLFVAACCLRFCGHCRYLRSLGSSIIDMVLYGGVRHCFLCLFLLFIVFLAVFLNCIIWFVALLLCWVVVMVLRFWARREARSRPTLPGVGPAAGPGPGPLGLLLGGYRPSSGARRRCHK